MKRIIYVIGSLDVGGTERHLVQLLPKLKARGWDVSVYCIGRRGAMAIDLEKQNIAVKGPPWEAKKGMATWFRFARLITAALGLLFVLLRQRPHIAHFFLPGAYMVGGPCALLLGIEICIMSRRSLNEYQPKRWILAWFEKQLHGYMHAVLGNSVAVVQQLAAEGVPENRITLIYNGVDLARFMQTRPRSEVRRELGVPPGCIVLIMVANLIPYKGHVDLIEALIQIREKIPSWRMLIVGRDDGMGEILREQAETAELDANIRWLGSRNDIAGLLNASDIGIHCSHEEGFSNAIIEAMAAGLPMVVTDVGGNAEAVTDGRTGLVVPPRSPNRLAEALLSITSDASCSSMGTRGRERVEKLFSLESCVVKYDSLYHSLLGDCHKISRI